MSALVIGREKMYEFLAPSCEGRWFKVIPDIEEDTRYKAVIVVLKGPDAESQKNFLRDQMREDRNTVGRLDRWIEFLVKQPWASIFTVGVSARFGGAPVFHKPSGEIEVISAPFVIAKLGDEVDGYVVQRGFDNCYRQVIDNTNGDDDEAATLILEKLVESGAIKGYVYTHEYQ